MTNLFYPEWLPIEEATEEIIENNNCIVINEDGNTEPCWWSYDGTVGYDEEYFSGPAVLFLVLPTPSDPMPEGLKKLMRLAKVFQRWSNKDIWAAHDAFEEAVKVWGEFSPEERKQIEEFE